ERLPPDRAALTCAQYYEDIGQPDQAEAQYQALLRMEPDNVSSHRALASFYLRVDQPAKAEPHLRRMADASSALSVEQQIWARRQLALLWSDDPTRFSQALALIDANLALAGENPRDRRLRAMLCATQPDKRRQALREIEETIDQQPLSLEEQCRLAQLYEATGDRVRAREQWRGVLTSEKLKPAYVALFTRFLARQGDLHDAQRWLLQLEKLEERHVSR